MVLTGCPGLSLCFGTGTVACTGSLDSSAGGVVGFEF